MYSAGEGKWGLLSILLYSILGYFVSKLHVHVAVYFGTERALFTNKLSIELYKFTKFVYIVIELHCT